MCGMKGEIVVRGRKKAMKSSETTLKYKFDFACDTREVEDDKDLNKSKTCVIKCTAYGA
jgi:hypothetical protein